MFDSLPADAVDFSYREREPKRVIEETTEIELRFNVYRDRPVKEIVRPTRYLVWDDNVEAHFDREYSSTMAHSPNHHIILTALIHIQRLAYICACDKLDIDYNPNEYEQLKLWPTRIDCAIPQLVTATTSLIQTYHCHAFDLRKDDHSYSTRATSIVSGVIGIHGTGLIFPVRRQYSPKSSHSPPSAASACGATAGVNWTFRGNTKRRSLAVEAGDA